MVPPIIRIEELFRLFIDFLVKTDFRTAVSFALTCKCHTEPTLSSLWKHQHSLVNLLKLLPSCTLVGTGTNFKVEIGHPSAEDWVKLRQYASWMRKLQLPSCNGNEIPTNQTLSLLSSNCPGGMLFPNLECLRWNIQDMGISLAYFSLFLTPQLKHVSFFTSSDDFMESMESSELAQFAKMISLLPPSLEHLSVTCEPDNEEVLQNALHSFICQSTCNVRSFRTSIPLPSTAILHPAKLPNLSSFATSQRPLQDIPMPIFSRLESFQLYITYRGVKTPLWLDLLGSQDNVILQNHSQSAIPATDTVGMLKSLSYHENFILDSAVLSSITQFRNLVYLDVNTYCHIWEENCNFQLTDNDIENLATTLPHLKLLWLGIPRSNCKTCKTTVASLMSISIHCLDLRELEIHCNTYTIVSDMQQLLGEPAWSGMVKCKVQNLSIGVLPYGIKECREDWETVQRGFNLIFPALDLRMESMGAHST